MNVLVMLLESLRNLNPVFYGSLWLTFQTQITSILETKHLCFYNFTILQPWSKETDAPGIFSLTKELIKIHNENINRLSMFGLILHHSLIHLFAYNFPYADVPLPNIVFKSLLTQNDIPKSHPLRWGRVTHFSAGRPLICVCHEPLMRVTIPPLITIYIDNNSLLLQ